MRKGLVLAAVAAAFLFGAWATEKGDIVDIGENPPEWDPQQIPPVSRVEVLNFPNPQAVAGTVNVGNLPAVQSVDGAVEVSNLPEIHLPIFLPSLW